MSRTTPTTYPFESADGYHLVVTVEPAKAEWVTNYLTPGTPAEPALVLTPQVTVRSSQLIEGQYVLNAGPLPARFAAQGDRDWAWAKEQIVSGVTPGRDYVLEPPGKKSHAATNGTSKWPWIFLDVYDLQPGGVPWAPYEMPFNERAKAIAAEAVEWIEADHPDWRSESERLGIAADLKRQQAEIARARERIQREKDQIVELRRRAGVLKAQQADTL